MSGLEDMMQWYGMCTRPDRPSWLIPASFSTMPPLVVRLVLAFPALERRYFNTLARCDGDVDFSAIFRDHVLSLGVTETELLTAATAIDQQMATVKLEFGSAVDEGVFLRLSTRSPKDALLKVTTPPLCAQSGLDVMMMLCSSARAHADVAGAAQASRDTPMLVFRPFVKELQTWSELRVFVSEAKITAASAYNPSSEHVRELLSLLNENGSPEGLGRSPVPLRLIKERLVPILPRAFVADVAFVGSGGKGDWLLIEVNPFSRATSGCLFSWGLDRHVLEHGIDGDMFEVRLAQNVVYKLDQQ